MRVIGYTKVIPPGNKNKVNKPFKPNHKLDIIRNFVSGVRVSGDNGLVYDGFDIMQCDVAVMQGYMHENSAHVPHINLRRSIAANTANKRFITADSNLFLYKAKVNEPHHYLRYSFDGVFADTAEYCNDSPGDEQWTKIQRDLGVKLKPWNYADKDNILLCLQRNGGWSMKGKDVVTWANTKIAEIRQHTTRPIVIRPHPGDKKAPEYVKKIVGDNIRISFEKEIVADLQTAFCSIVYNSSPGVASVIEGVPVICEDFRASQVQEVCFQRLDALTKLRALDREVWIRKISQCHWSFADLKSGEAWQWMKRYVK